jgi:hypothetical protein
MPARRTVESNGLRLERQLPEKVGKSRQRFTRTTKKAFLAKAGARV